MLRSSMPSGTKLVQGAGVLCALCLLALPASSSAAPVVRSAAGANNAAIAGTVNQFRADLGGALNPNVATTFETGRREINWDGTPDAFSAPNNLPPNFFNVNSPRGVVFSTPGTGFQVSANAASGVPVRFGNINPNYPNIFETFSPERLFTPLGSTQTTVDFFQAGTTTAATTNGFGAVFTDVDVSGSSSIQFFDATGTSLGTYGVPATGGDKTLSFLGVSFPDGERVAKVTITSGNQVLGPANNAEDLVVMDDFVYGEPRAVPPPVLSLALSAKKKQSPDGLLVTASCSNGCELKLRAKGKAEKKYSSKKSFDFLLPNISFHEPLAFNRKNRKRIEAVNKTKATVKATATDAYGQVVVAKKKVTLKP